jgi:hypothetical protein
MSQVAATATDWWRDALGARDLRPSKLSITADVDLRFADSPKDC